MILLRAYENSILQLLIFSGILFAFIKSNITISLSYEVKKRGGVMKNVKAKKLINNIALDKLLIGLIFFNLNVFVVTILILN